MVSKANIQDYVSAEQSLLPSGSAWNTESSSTLTKLLTALAETWVRIHNKFCRIRDEADPRNTLELLEDWETFCGLPDKCSSAVSTTLQERRKALVNHLTARGSQSISFFKNIVKTLEYSADIKEYRPFIAGISKCGDVLEGAPNNRHHWRVTINEPRLTSFRCGASQIGDKLGKITYASDLECVLDRLKPAQTVLHFEYKGE
ncbi:MAG: YmfQ family protein [Alphaproteobacteria bacterium]